MRRIRYEVLVPHGSETADGDLADFLHSIPYFFTSGLIPPLAVLNDLLGKGIADRGMSGGCKWEPFQLTREEWEELVSHLKKAKGYELVEPPEWVKTELDWATWRMARRLRIPPEEQIALKRLLDEEREWRQRSQEAAAQGDDELMLECHVKAVRLGMKSTEIIERYRGGTK